MEKKRGENEEREGWGVKGGREDWRNNGGEGAKGKGKRCVWWCCEDGGGDEFGDDDGFELEMMERKAKMVQEKNIIIGDDGGSDSNGDSDCGYEAKMTMKVKMVYENEELMMIVMTVMIMAMVIKRTQTKRKSPTIKYINQIFSIPIFSLTFQLLFPSPLQGNYLPPLLFPFSWTPHHLLYPISHPITSPLPSPLTY